MLEMLWLEDLTLVSSFSFKTHLIYGSVVVRIQWKHQLLAGSLLPCARPVILQYWCGTNCARLAFPRRTRHRCFVTTKALSRIPASSRNIGSDQRKQPRQTWQICLPKCCTLTDVGSYLGQSYIIYEEKGSMPKVSNHSVIRYLLRDKKLWATMQVYVLWTVKEEDRIAGTL